MSCSALEEDLWIERPYEVEEVDPELEYLKADEELDRESDWED